MKEKRKTKYEQENETQDEFDHCREVERPVACTERRTKQRNQMKTMDKTRKTARYVVIIIINEVNTCDQTGCHADVGVGCCDGCERAQGKS